MLSESRAEQSRRQSQRLRSSECRSLSRRGTAHAIVPEAQVQEALASRTEHLEDSYYHGVDIKSSQVAGLFEQALHPRLIAVWEAEKQFTPQQEAAMVQFRCTAMEKGLLAEHWDNKPTFYRFCQARQFEASKAIEMFERHLEWRKEWQLDEFVSTPNGPMPRLLAEFRFTEMPQVKQVWPYIHHKVDKQGRPVYYDRAGLLSMASLQRVTKADRLLRAFIFDCEATRIVRMPACSLKARKFIDKQITVLDMHGFSLSTFDSETRNRLKQISAITSNNYPETLEKMFIVNAPVVFRVVWNFVRPLLDKRTREKIEILGGPSDYKPRLAAHIDFECLPKFLHGMDTQCDFTHEHGPWERFAPFSRMRGGLSEA